MTTDNGGGNVRLASKPHVIKFLKAEDTIFLLSGMAVLIILIEVLFLLALETAVTGSAWLLLVQVVA